MVDRVLLEHETLRDGARPRTYRATEPEAGVLTRGGRGWRRTRDGTRTPGLYARDSWQSSVGAGRAYLFGTGLVDVAAAGNLRVLVSNPSSDTVASIVAVAGLVTAQCWLEVVANPTEGLPAGDLRPHLRANPLVGRPSDVEVTVDADAAPLEGELSGVVWGLPAGTPFDVDGPLVVGPGRSVGLNVAFEVAGEVALVLSVVQEIV